MRSALKFDVFPSQFLMQRASVLRPPKEIKECTITQKWPFGYFDTIAAGAQSQKRVI
jgi:hypothetical protein